MATTPQYNFTVTLDDLSFILKQIKIAEATTLPNGQIDGAALAAAVGSPLLPNGLRTVDGTWNNLLPGMERLGAADNVMPRLVPVNLQGPYATPTTTASGFLPANSVIDPQPRIISNLIVDQTASNFAAIIAADDRAANSTFPGLDTVQVTENGTLFIPNQSPDIGLSAPFNGVMTFFGQFFDHGLDLITKGNGLVFVPLMPDDPLYVEGSPTNFMVLSRAVDSVGPGPDGVLGTGDDDPNAHTNTTTPFVDQNQTYTSHPSHQVFLREYELVPTGTDGHLAPASTGNLLSGDYGLGTWGDVKTQAAEMLGIQLTDQDVFNVPLVATDRYGNFIPGTNGFAQIVTAHGLVEANPSDNGGQGTLLPPDTFRTDHQFLIDIAHNAVPTNDFGAVLAPDADNVTGGVPNPNYDPTRPASVDNPLFLPQAAGTYDNETLDRHYATGDGRGNENIGLTTMHAIFHSEHDRLVAAYKDTILGSGDTALINEWLATPLAAGRDLTLNPLTQAEIDGLAWNGDRLFQAGRFVTEMQYQHLVFEEFARGVAPTVDPFVFSNSPTLDPAIVEEFANVVYRFGHSMLTETVARLDPTLAASDIGLIQAFLNPVEFTMDGTLTQEEAIGSVIRGMSRQVGNEIDEFITEALRNNLVGLPLDLATLNMSRARETGAPTFNEARAVFYEQTGDSQFAPYTSWADLAPHLKNPASIINFIAAYGQHESILTATTLEEKRDAAFDLVMGVPGETAAQRTARMDFLHGTGTWNADASGLNDVDFWVGGLAEAKLEFGGMLGPTFNYVFENQMENLQNGDRFYYLSRTQGLNLLNELEANSFSALAMRNSDLGMDGNTTHLPGMLFATPSYTLEMDQSLQRTGILGPDGVTMNGDPTRGNPFLDAFNPLVVRVAAHLDNDGDGIFDDGGVLSYAYDGGDHVVLGGTAGDDFIYGGRGMDTIWGDAGNDRIDAGDEADQVHGGDGDDIITDHGTVAGGADFLRGDEGNDVISGGAGNDVLFGGGGSDFIYTGNDFTEVFAGRGDDFILGGNGPDGLMGNEGDDWIEGGEGFDGLSGENSQLFFNSTIIGHDVLNGNGNDTDYDGESGDDIMIQGPGIQRSNGMFGFDWASHKGDVGNANSDLGIPIFNSQEPFTLRDRFDSVEGLSGWNGDDILVGASALKGAAGGAGAGPGNPPDESDLKSQNVALIDGFAELLGMTQQDVEALAFNTSVIDVTLGAEVIIGGAGSDTITGNLGNDYLDGDAWLNTRIRVTNTATDANTQANELLSVDSMTELTSRMVSGEINPGQLHIVREILQSETAATDVDTAVYHGDFIDYTLTSNTNGTVTVAHTTVQAGVLDDGIDQIRNFERAQFADRTVALVNVAPEILSFGGAASFTVQRPENDSFVAFIDATDANVTDGILFPDQVLSYSLFGDDATRFQIDQLSGLLSFVAAPNFEVATDLDNDNVYDVIVRVSDGSLFDEQALAIEVINADDAVTGSIHLSVGSQTNTAATLAAASTLADEDAAGPLTTTLQWQRFDTATNTWVDIAAATGSTLANQAGVTERVVTQYTDAFGTHTITSVETAVVGTSGNNNLTGTAGSDIILGLGGNDTLNGGAGDDLVDGGAGNDTLVAAAGDGNDTLVGGAGTDTYTLAATTAAAVVNLTTGTATSAQIGADTLSGVENVTGSQGGDTITDSTAANVLIGGGGQDTFIMVGDNVRDTIDGVGAGNTVDYSAATANLTVALNNNNAVVGGTGTTAATSDIVTNVDNFIGGSGNDNITGNGAANVLTGGGGNDTLTGLGGADNLIGGAGNDTLVASVNDGNDTMNGGAGTDTYVLANTTAAANVNLTTGVSTSGQTGTDSLTNIENVTGSQGGDTITDSSVANVLTGGGGADTFVMTNDNVRDTVDGAGGSNTVDYSASTANLNVTLGTNAVVGNSGTSAGTSDVISNIDNFTGGSGNDNVTGNGNANVLVGNGGNDTLTGLGGADTLNGGAGNDTLSGGNGGDTLIGGAGVDSLTGGGGADVFDFNATTDSGVGAGNRDIVQDFATGTDDLDFSTIDANTGAGGNQAFAFSGVEGAAITGAGQLRYDVQGVAPNETTLVNANVNANVAPDMQVQLVGQQNLTAADVVA
ncbi:MULTISPECIES: peroxidase family protein [Ramlibacter]|nr:MULTISPECIES: peroxidase family protein [Ramlibacter]MBA2961432.1 M10 family metallopeptidase C-terminal domain-containing protein [Ramlibacter sp. CGMCC 1.13660]